jgi:hypothetical protein
MTKLAKILKRRERRRQIASRVDVKEKTKTWSTLDHQFRTRKIPCSAGEKREWGSRRKVLKQEREKDQVQAGYF